MLVPYSGVHMRHVLYSSTLIHRGVYMLILRSEPTRHVHRECADELVCSLHVCLATPRMNHLHVDVTVQEP